MKTTSEIANEVTNGLNLKDASYRASTQVQDSKITILCGSKRRAIIQDGKLTWVDGAILKRDINAIINAN